MPPDGDDRATLLRPATWRRAAWTALQSGLMVLIAVQGAALGGAVAVAVSVFAHRPGLPEWASVGVGVTTGVVTVGVSGWLVLGGWRGAGRAVAVAAVGVAAALGTFHSPLLLDRLREEERVLAAAAAMFGGAAMTGVALLVLSPRPRAEPPAS
ncbi:MAG: hypothetical protein M9894_36465 [Planctomycetes bacterium]|nr:hypothetical protein [Planctomycetota bacterium]